MKIPKSSFVSRVVGGVLGGIIGLVSSVGLAFESQNIDNLQIPPSSVSVKQDVKQDKKQNENKSEQLYRTKTGKCYHREGCPCLRQSKIKVSREEVKESELRSCKRCCK